VILPRLLLDVLEVLLLKCRDNANYFLSIFENWRLFVSTYEVFGLVNLFSNLLKLMYGCKEYNYVTAALETELDSWNFFVVWVKMWTHGLMTWQHMRGHIKILNLIFCAWRYLKRFFWLLEGEPYCGLYRHR